jgi:lysophospholipase L1-like esterase
MTQPRKHTIIEGRRAWAAGHVLVTGLICLGLATFLNAASLLKTAERQPLGGTRTVAVGIMGPLADISGVLLLDRPRRLVDRGLGRYTPPADEPTVVADPVVIYPEGWNTSSTTSTSTPGETTTTTTAPAGLREITAAEPMKLWIIGDSFVELFGPALENDAADTGVMRTEVDFRFISGLVRSDYFDWPAHITRRLPEVQPDAVVVMFGGNDGQPLTWQGTELQPDTPEWLEVYHGLVGEAMDVLLTGTTRVYWVGLPIMRDDRFTQRVIGFNRVYEEEAAERPGVVYVNIFDLFKDENGRYSTYLRTDSGNLLDMRMDDGAHFTWNGAYRLSGFVLEAIASEWDFTDSL